MNPTVAVLEEIAEINPKINKKFNLTDIVSFVPMAAVSEKTCSIEQEETRQLGEVIKGFTYFKQGDILLAKITPCFENGKIAIANIKNETGFGTTEFHVIRPHNNKLDNKYLYYFMRQESFRHEGAEQMTGSAGQRRVPKLFIQKLKIPLPPLDIQKKIAIVLDKADHLRRKRREALEKLDQLVQSVFLEMFGDPISNPKCWNVQTLNNTVTFIGGGTPSTLNDEYYTGSILWISPKDMKATFINDSIDKITLEAIKNSAVKLIEPMSVLIVVRSGILKKTLPLAVNTVPVTINQDMKALIPNKNLNSIFLMYQLKLQTKNILHTVRATTADNISTDILKKNKIILPPIELQDKFKLIVEKYKTSIVKNNKSKDKLDTLFNSLIQKAFKGELKFNDSAFSELEEALT